MTTRARTDRSVMYVITCATTWLGLPDVEGIRVTLVKWEGTVPTDETGGVEFAGHSAVAGRDRSAFDREVAAAALRVNEGSRGYSQ